MITEFKQDLNLIIDKLKKKEIFSLSRYGDGEYNILRKYEHNAINEFHYSPKLDIFDESRLKLIQSLQYKKENYIVGIIPACCYRSGYQGFKWMKEFSGQSENNLTWASIFWHANAMKSLKEMIPLFANYNVVAILNEKSKIDKLPFKIKKVFYVGYNAFINNWNLIEVVKNYIKLNKIEKHLFLFGVGPFSNILIYELNKEFYNNTYLDIGSMFDYMFFSFKSNRPVPGQFDRHSCLWY
jgi:hypothetical protein